MTAEAQADRALFAAALDLPAEADDAALVERIGALRLVRSAETLDQVCRTLGMTADASPLACAAELCRRLSDDWHLPAVLAMQVIEVKEATRRARVGELRRAAIRAARDGSAA